MERGEESLEDGMRTAGRHTLDRARGMIRG